MRTDYTILVMGVVLFVVGMLVGAVAAAVIFVVARRNQEQEKFE